MISHSAGNEGMPRFLPTTWVLATVLLFGCANQPERSVALDDARTVYAAAQGDPQVARLATAELNQATEALKRAEAAWTDRAAAEQVAHLAYLAMIRSAIATEVARLRASETAAAAAAQERSRIQQELRARATAREQAVAALQQQEQLESLRAVKTNRGMVVTLGDIVFDSGQASLNVDGLHWVQKLAEFMNRYQRRTVAIEGFTDSGGGYSRELGESRADAVRRSLLDAGIGANRITTRSYGKDFPIATNDTVAGRTWNRRVEIVISDENGNVVAR